MSARERRYLLFRWGELDEAGFPLVPARRFLGGRVVNAEEPDFEPSILVPIAPDQADGRISRRGEHRLTCWDLPLYPATATYLEEARKARNLKRRAFSKARDRFSRDRDAVEFILARSSAERAYKMAIKGALRRLQEGILIGPVMTEQEAAVFWARRKSA